MTDEQTAKELTYGELMMLCKGHGTSKIYERHLDALAARERAVWLEAAKMAKTFSKGYEVDWLRISTKGEISRQVCIDIAELIREQAKKEQP